MPLFAVLTYADVSAPSVPPLQHHGQEPAADIWAGADVRMTCRLRPDDVVAIRSGIEHDGAASPGPAQLTGFVIVEAVDFAAAIALAHHDPAAQSPFGSVEVRPVAAHRPSVSAGR